ncbi:MAG: hypothetical protein VCD31_00370, partial [Alphaproteobacteria bacterium]
MSAQFAGAFVFAAAAQMTVGAAIDATKNMTAVKRLGAAHSLVSLPLFDASPAPVKPAQKLFCL